ncbi:PECTINESTERASE 68-RELATED [Salix koriyanagi]|uniref:PECTINESTERASE 68-RELATED n=1 Tax=Salix koriyanagi TaxID=2511006 RepID=A0A9Q0T0A6_9ROSI|nr:PECTINESTERASE 68-RELATED [Salix koriyanagi]
MLLMASLSYSFLFFYSYFILTLFLLHAPLLVTGSTYRYKVEPSSLNRTASTANSTKHHHKWVGPVGYREITVDVNGAGEFLSVQAAVDAVPENNRENVMILISAGYYEKVTVPASKPYITFSRRRERRDNHRMA